MASCHAPAVSSGAVLEVLVFSYDESSRESREQSADDEVSSQMLLNSMQAVGVFGCHRQAQETTSSMDGRFSGRFKG